MTGSSAPLAAIRIDRDSGIDALLEDVARYWTGQGLRVRGVIQTRGVEDPECHCADMDLVSLTDGRVFRISQPLGHASRGCRLDPGALAEVSAVLAADLAEGCDLLILNRFGKGESDGRGFRDLIFAALEQGIAVLTCVRDAYAADWSAFGGGMTCDLPADRKAVIAWTEGQLRPMVRQAAE